MGRSSQSGKGHRFGGDWTTAKLEVLAGYLRSYTTALKDKPTQERPFRKGYIDAFAGTGYRDTRREDDASQTSCCRTSPSRNPRTCWTAPPGSR